MTTVLTPLESRIKKMESEGGLGLHRDQIALSAHHPRWKRIFSDEAYAIFDALKIGDCRLYHIGSTAITGISAKPVIDILGSVSSLSELDQKRHCLEAIGYIYQGEYGIQGRRYCVLHDSSQTKSFVHLHVFEHGSPQIESHLLFRNYLRSNKEAARIYNPDPHFRARQRSI